jgi:3-hydroxybutyrate dehydrogenase
MRLKDQAAVITGAASGIGLEIARVFVREGANVAIADLDAGAAAAAAAELSRGAGKAIPIAMDVTREDQVDAGISQMVGTLGRIDILVCNAGIQVISPLEALSLADWQRVLAVHLDGAFLATRAALRHMYARGRGSIIYMGSVHSKEASVLKAPYVAAKHGLLGLTRVVAKEGARHGVRANLICPGFVRTALVDRQIPEQARVLGLSEEEVVRQVMLKETVDGEFTTTRDVAEAALFFASFESAALTGQSLVVSHGWSMQ